MDIQRKFGDLAVILAAVPPGPLLVFGTLEGRASARAPILCLFFVPDVPAAPRSLVISLRPYFYTKSHKMSARRALIFLDVLSETEWILECFFMSVASVRVCMPRF